MLRILDDIQTACFLKWSYWYISSNEKNPLMIGKVLKSISAPYRDANSSSYKLSSECYEEQEYNITKGSF